MGRVREDDCKTNYAPQRASAKAWIRGENIGLTERTFKQCFNNHQITFRHKDKASAIELSKHVWSLKRVNATFAIEWSICCRAPAYTHSSKTCALCLVEKLCIVKADISFLLNRRSELVSTCWQCKKHLLIMHKDAPPWHSLLHSASLPMSFILFFFVVLPLFCFCTSVFDLNTTVLRRLPFICPELFFLTFLSFPHPTSLPAPRRRTLYIRWNLTDFLSFSWPLRLMIT